MSRRGRRILVAAVVLAVIASVTVRWLAGSTTKTRAEGGWSGLRIAWPNPDERVRIGSGGSLDVAVYRPGKTPTPVAAVLLVHGNREEGSDAPLYRILARRLANRGAIVYAMNLPGFGKSQAIPGDEPVAAPRLVDGVRTGIEYLRTQSSPSIPRIVIGHSLGANLVLNACSEPDLAVVASEPGRRIRERVVDPPHPELADFTEKLRKNVRGGVVTEDGVRALYEAVDPERPASAGGAKRCDVLYSRRLPPEELEAVERIGRARGAEIVWLDHWGHDYGAVALLGGVAFPARLIDFVADTILSRSGESGMRNE